MEKFSSDYFVQMDQNEKYSLIIFSTLTIGVCCLTLLFLSIKNNNKKQI